MDTVNLAVYSVPCDSSEEDKLIVRIVRQTPEYQESGCLIALVLPLAAFGLVAIAQILGGG